MLYIMVEVNAPAGSAQGVKEALAQYLEYFGDAKIISIEEKLPEQLKIGES